MSDRAPVSGHDDEQDSGALTRYGFRWGPMEVSRACSFERSTGRTRVVQVKAGRRTLDIYVSETGRSVRVFEGGKELKA